MPNLWQAATQLEIECRHGESLLRVDPSLKRRSFAASWEALLATKAHRADYML